MRIEALYSEAKSAIDVLLSGYHVSEASSVGEIAKKTLAIAAASAFEFELTILIFNFAAEASNNNRFCQSLIKTRVLDRQFHTLFGWKDTQASSFFGYFGSEAKRYYDDARRSDPALDQAGRDFLDLGNLRNEIVHQDYTTYVFNKSLDDVIIQYRSAKQFVTFIEAFLKKAARNAL